VAAKAPVLGQDVAQIGATVEKAPPNRHTVAKNING
jgi:hypothetical protein